MSLEYNKHFTAEGMACDEARTRVLNAYSLTVLRFTNREIDSHFPAVCMKIDTAVRERLDQQKEE